jgi:SnoaL-like domain
MELWELLARESIRDTVARYTHCADKGRFEELASLFQPDAVLDIGEGRVLQGRDGIRGFLGGQRTDLQQQTGASLVRHHVSNLRLDFESPVRARGVAYFLVVTDRGPDHWGQYRDVYTQSAERWLFAERRVKLEGYGPDSWVGSRRPD